MIDTHPEIARKIQERISALSGSEKVVMACSMFDFAKELATAQILEADPRACEQEIRRQIFLRFYEEDFSPEQIAKLFR